jgi:3-hydroxy-D-aspartate aldolase
MRSKLEIPTPALLLDLDAFDANLALMADRVRRSGKHLRPHAKAHKCPEIARRQIAAGAIGVCVATVAEAECMAGAGITGLLLTSPLADPLKMARVIATGAMVVVDHVDQAAWYNAAARAAGPTVDVLVDLDVGDHRTGAGSAAQAIEIAQAIDQASHLRFRGIQGYSVSGSHTPGIDQRRQVSESAFHTAVAVRDALVKLGIAGDTLTGGSTGTWDIDTQLPEVTEIQAGSYVLMDLAYGKLGLPFRNALTVLTTVVSANHKGFVTVDGGFKAFSTDRGYGPEAVGVPGSQYRWGGDEFGYLDCPHTPRLGSRIQFIPPHCDPTVNLYDRIYVYRDEVVEGVWPIKSAKRDTIEIYDV